MIEALKDYLFSLPTVVSVAAWLFSQLKDIGVSVPDLEKRQREIARIIQKRRMHHLLTFMSRLTEGGKILTNNGLNGDDAKLLDLTVTTIGADTYSDLIAQMDKLAVLAEEARLATRLGKFLQDLLPYLVLYALLIGTVTKLSGSRSVLWMGMGCLCIGYIIIFRQLKVIRDTIHRIEMEPELLVDSK